ncbi:MAG: 50S ribosomal protein L13 [Candidatus Dojkabacteria bacterium]
MKQRKINKSEIEERWYIIDANGKRPGPLASFVAQLLQGKNDPLAKDYLIPKNHVIVINASKIDVAPKRVVTKFYKWYSGFPGGLRFKSMENIMKDNAVYPLEKAIKGMLPKNKRGRAIFRNLRVYKGDSHPHEAQKPIQIDVNSFKF